MTIISIQPKVKSRPTLVGESLWYHCLRYTGNKGINVWCFIDRCLKLYSKWCSDCFGISNSIGNLTFNIFSCLFSPKSLLSSIHRIYFFFLFLSLTLCFILLSCAIYSFTSKKHIFDLHCFLIVIIWISLVISLCFAKSAVYPCFLAGLVSHNLLTMSWHLW